MIVVAAALLVWSIFLLLAAVLTGLLGLAIINSTTRLVQWGILESTAQMAGPAAVGLLVLGLLACWLWRRDLQVSGLRSISFGSASKFAVVWFLISVGGLTLMVLYSEPLAFQIWQRPALLQTVVGAIPAIPVSWAFMRIIGERIIGFVDGGPIGGDARHLPRPILKNLEREGLLPQEPWWGFVYNPRNLRSRQTARVSRNPAQITQRGWVVGPDLLALFTLTKEVDPTSRDAALSKSKWGVEGRRITLDGNVEIRGRDIPATWERAPSPETVAVVGREAYLLALPLSLRRKLTSVVAPSTQHVSTVPVPRAAGLRLIMAVYANSSSLVAIRAEHLTLSQGSGHSTAGSKNSAKTMWRATVIRAEFAGPEEARTPRPPLPVASTAEDPWADWNTYSRVSPR